MSVSDVVSLINAVASIAILGVIVWVVAVLRKHPGSSVSVELPGLGKGEVSIEDAGWMIRDRLSSVTDEERDALRKFNNEQRILSAEQATEVGADILTALKNNGLIRPHQDAAGQETLRLALWGYRLLKDFMKVGDVNTPWEWLSPDEKQKIQG